MDEKAIIENLQRLNQRIDEVVLPLLNKYDVYLSGEKGSNGLLGDMRVVKLDVISVRERIAEHIKTHWQFFVGTISVAGLIVAVVKLF